MVAVKRLTEQEAALAALLMDDTGVDLLEWASKNGAASDGCMRLRRYQWLWFTDRSTFSISACARDVGKTFRIIGKAAAHVYASPGTDIFITAPGADHLRPLADKIEELILSVRFLREALKSGYGKTGIGRIPSFEAKFRNGAKIVTRLPKMDGRGVKGQHAKKIIIDESQDMPEEAWDQIWPTMRPDLEGRQTEIYGVTVGNNGRMDQIVGDVDSHYTKWRVIAPEKESWGDEERRAAEKAYGSTTSLRYAQNIYGRSAGTYSMLLNTARLMACVQISQTPWAVEYNRDLYRQFTIDDEAVTAIGLAPVDQLLLPASHRDPMYVSYFAGWDIGLVRDDSEILFFGKFARKKPAGFAYRLLTRLSMKGIPAPQQIEAVKWLLDFYSLQRDSRLAIDGTGLGLPIAQSFDAMPGYREVVRGYGFSEKILAGYEDRPLGYKETQKDLEIRAKTPDYGLSRLRELVDAGELELPMVPELLASWQGAGEDHLFHAGVLFGVAVGQHTLDAVMDAMKDKRPVVPRFG